MKSSHFWNWVRDETEPESRTLYLNGVIAEESWFSDEVTPAAFKADLTSGSGPITVWINSVGGDCVAAAQIYNMLMEYPHDVTVKIDGIAASAASVIAMAGTKVCMSPVAILMIHNPATMAYGDKAEMEKTIGMLSEVKESIINAYEIKSGIARTKIAHMMDNETWLNARKAVELGFADEILFDKSEETEPEPSAMLYTPMTVTNSLAQKMKPKPKKPPAVHDKVLAETLEKRLQLLIH